MQNNRIETNSVYMKHVSRKLCQRTKAPLMAGTLVVTEVDTSKLPKLKTKDEQTKNVENLEFWEQEEYQNIKDEYQKISRIIRKDLAAVHRLLESTCHSILQNRL